MSAERLREAAQVARDEWQAETNGPFKHAARIHLAVADWLDFEANAEEFDIRVGLTEREATSGSGRLALAVANAYLGGA